MSPTFSVIIPTYNRPTLVDTAVQSVLTQSSPAHEIIVVDDGSAGEGIGENTRGHSRVTVLRHERNRGVPAARNTALRQATGDYAAFLDSDDLWPPWTLMSLCRAARDFDSPAVVVGNAFAVQADGRHVEPEQAPFAARWYDNFQTYRTSRKDWWFAPSGVAVRLDVLRRIGGFWSGRTLSEDLDLWYRLGTERGFTRIETPVTYGYRIHGGGMSRQHRKLYRGARRIIAREHAGRYAAAMPERGERRKVITPHLRHRVRELAAEGYPAMAWDLYRRLLAWNLAAGRFRFLLGFPAERAMARFRSTAPGRR